MRKLFLFILFFILFKNGFAVAVTQIPTVIVKKPKSSTLSLAQKHIISHDDLIAQGATNLASALQSLGGVQLQDTTGNGSQVLLSMRGFGSNASSNTLLLVNGIPITNPDIAPPDLNAIPIEEIEYVEITAGSESVLYGDQAVGGIVNVVTRGEYKKDLSVLCASGSYNQKNCYASYTDTYRNLQYNVGIYSQHSNGYREHNDYDQTQLAGTIKYPYSKGSLEFDYRIAKETMQYPGALTAEEVHDDPRQANNHTDFFSDWNGFFLIKQKQILNNSWNLETDIMQRDMRGHGVLTSSFTQSRVINYIQPKLIGTINNNIVTSGLDFETDGYRLDTDFGVTKDHLQKYGLFGLIQHPVNERLKLSIGARMAEQTSDLETTSTFDTINRGFASNIGSEYWFTQDLKFYLRQAGSFRFPKADENASTLPNVHGLKTQRGNAYESGLEWNWREFHTQFEIYQLNLKDEITFDPTQTPEAPFGTNRNLPPTTRTGFSISEKYPLNESITLNGQYHYVNARFQSGVNEGNRIPLVSENIVNAGINISFWAHWNIYHEMIFTGNQYPANDDANIGKKIGGYTIYNFNIRYVYEKFTASFRMNNVFNKNYFLYTVFQPFEPFETFYPAPGRNFLLSLTYQFL